MSRSTVHRYASTLATLGYLEQGPSRKYRLSPRVSNVALAMLNSVAVRQVAHEHLRRLRAETGRTVSLGVLDGTKVVCIDRSQGHRQGQYAVDVGIGPGTRLPVHCTAAGKALLVRLPAAEQQTLITEPQLTRRTPKTITTRASLRAELKRIVEDSMAVENEELLDCRLAIAAVVADAETRADRGSRVGRSGCGVHPRGGAGANRSQNHCHGAVHRGPGGIACVPDRRLRRVELLEAIARTEVIQGRRPLTGQAGPIALHNSGKGSGRCVSRGDCC